MTYEPGIITTVAGDGGSAGMRGTAGRRGAALMSEPFMCAFDGAGNLYVAEAMNHCVRRVDAATGVIVTIAGTGAEGYSGDGGAGCRRDVQPALFVAGGRQWRRVRG